MCGIVLIAEHTKSLGHLLLRRRRCLIIAPVTESGLREAGLRAHRRGGEIGRPARHHPSPSAAAPENAGVWPGSSARLG